MIKILTCVCFRTYYAGDRHQPQLRWKFFLKSTAESVGTASHTFWPKNYDLDPQDTLYSLESATSAENRSKTATWTFCRDFSESFLSSSEPLFRVV